MKKAALLCLALFTVAACAYTAFWIWGANRIREEMNDILADAAGRNVRIQPRTLDVRGFPGMPVAFFSGRAVSGPVTLEIPALSVRSRFIPGESLIIDAPQGIAVVEPREEADLWSLDSIHISAIIPDRLPNELVREDMTAWRDSGQSLTVESLEIRKGRLRLSASGSVFLDESLQPAGSLQAQIAGHQDFLAELQTKKLIGTREAILAGTVLSGLSRPNPETGETTIPVALSIQNRTLFAGPLRLGEMPYIPWSWRTLPPPAP